MRDVFDDKGIGVQTKEKRMRIKIEYERVIYYANQQEKKRSQFVACTKYSN